MRYLINDYEGHSDRELHMVSCICVSWAVKSYHSTFVCTNVCIRDLPEKRNQTVKNIRTCIYNLPTYKASHIIVDTLFSAILLVIECVADVILGNSMQVL